MSIETFAFMGLAVVITLIATVIHTTVTGKDSDEDIKKVANLYQSILFYGLIVVAVSVTFYFYFWS